jgi:hypothetical protein
MMNSTHKAELIVEIDAAELAVRMCEARACLKRPTHSAWDALETMEPEFRVAWLRAAHAAITYWQECTASARRPS